MPDVGRHLTPAERAKLRHITSANGVGRMLLAPTAAAASGAYFMTMWFTVLGPLVPSPGSPCGRRSPPR